MRMHIGEEYEGVISGVTKWGIYVELPNTVEGLVHVVDLRDDHYNFIEQTYEMVGEHTGKTYKPVSYTHLDVYKRQELFISPTVWMRLK